MHKSLISVIVPVYNVEKYLARCIESIRVQTYSNTEIILVDDGSSDKCPEICDGYAMADERIKVIHKMNGGTSSARNAGLDIMNGEFVSFVDSDDFLHPDCLEILYEMCINGQCEIAQCAYVKGMSDNFNGILVKGKNDVYNKVDALISRRVRAGVCGRLYKSGLFNNERFPCGKTYEDEAMTYRIVYKASRIAITGKKLYYYFQTPVSIMRNTKHFISTDFIDILEKRLEYFRDKEKSLLELSYEYFCLSLMLFYIRCKKDRKNTNDRRQILLLYNHMYNKSVKNEITPLKYKLMFTLFRTCPDACSFAVNFLRLRK
ncbi:MAG: glycosyltransferase [Candidatus Margulisbacteria bacterium]|nr:glycosyltransferase [Candidatus Margulisiibacteriota bacterium]